MNAQQFDMQNIPHIVDYVLPMWRPQTNDETFARNYVEYIVRNNIFSPELSVQLTKNSNAEFLAAAFAERKTDKNDSRKWLQEKMLNSSDAQKRSFDSLVKYLEHMDTKTLALMNDDDIKISLFVSLRAGYGSAALNELTVRLKKLGYKNMYLWTDVECNWQWYTNHGYELVSKENYAEYTTASREFTTFVFRKPLVEEK